MVGRESRSCRPFATTLSAATSHHATLLPWLTLRPPPQFKTSNGFTIVTADTQGEDVEVRDRRPVVLTAEYAAFLNPRWILNRQSNLSDSSHLDQIRSTGTCWTAQWATSKKALRRSAQAARGRTPPPQKGEAAARGGVCAARWSLNASASAGFRTLHSAAWGGDCLRSDLKYSALQDFDGRHRPVFFPELASCQASARHKQTVCRPF